MENKIKEVAEYCRRHIDGYDAKKELALDAMGRKEQIDWNFAHEIENYAQEWAEDNGYDVDFLEGIDVEEILWAD